MELSPFLRGDSEGNGVEKNKKHFFLIIRITQKYVNGKIYIYKRFIYIIMPTRNKTYYKNDLMIKKAYMQVLKKTGTMPTQQKVAEITGLTQKTVWQHLDAIDLREVVRPFKVWSDDVLNALKDKSLEGDYQAIRLYFMLTYDWSEKHEVKADIKADVKAKVVTTVKIPSNIAKKIGDELAKEAVTSK